MLCAVDLSGRGYLGWQMELPTREGGHLRHGAGGGVLAAPLSAELRGSRSTSGSWPASNSHHILEAVFKGMGRALRQAVAIDAGPGDEIPSTKGML